MDGLMFFLLVLAVPSEGFGGYPTSIAENQGFLDDLLSSTHIYSTQNSLPDMFDEGNAAMARTTTGAELRKSADGQLSLLASRDLFDQFVSAYGMSTSPRRGSALAAACDNVRKAFHKLVNRNDLPSITQVFMSDFQGDRIDMNYDDGVESCISYKLPRQNTKIDMLHEIGHSYIKSPWLTANGVNGHWGFAGLNKWGQVGGYKRDAIRCKIPENAVPSPSSPCEKGPDGLVHILLDGNAGSPTTSHDEVGAYADIELYLMGLKSSWEIAGEFIPLCKYRSSTEIPGQTDMYDVACEEFSITDASDIQPYPGQQTVPVKGSVRVAPIILYPDFTALDAGDTRAVDILASYGLPELFADATYQLASLQVIGYGPSDSNAPPSPPPNPVVTPQPNPWITPQPPDPVVAPQPNPGGVTSGCTDFSPDWDSNWCSYWQQSCFSGMVFQDNAPVEVRGQRISEACCATCNQ